MKKKLYKLLSVVLSACMLLSVCFISGAMTVSAEEKVLDYYVKGNGTGNGMSIDSPAPSVEVALKSMVQNGNLTASDVANVWIMQDADELRGNADRTHNLAYWGVSVAHENAIEVKSHPSNTYTGGLKETVLVDEDKLGNGGHGAFVIGGPTVLNDIKVLAAHKSNFQKSTVISNGNDLTVNLTTKFAYLNGNSQSDYTAEGGVTSLIIDKANFMYIKDSFNASANTTVYTKPYTVKITHPGNGANGEGYYFGDANAVFKENVTLIADFQRSGIERIYLDSNNDTYGDKDNAATYEKDINIKLRNTSGFAFRNSSKLITVYGGINMIVSDSCGCATKPEDALGGMTKNKDGTGAAPFWVVNIADANYDHIGFYGETGKFQLQSNCTAVATHTDGTVANSDPYGVLDLSAKPGKWKVVISVNRVKVYDYYVKPGGTGDGTDATNPAPDVETAIDTINECKLNDKETANIYIMQDVEAPAKGEINGNKAYHNMAYWSVDGIIASHDAKIVIKPHKDNKVATTYLFTTDLIGDQDEITLGGPTQFEDVKIVFPHSNDDYYGVNANGKELVVGAGVSYGYVYRNGANGKDWDGSINNIAFLAHSLVKPATYTKSFRVTFNNKLSAADGKVYIPANDGGGTFTLKGDVTVDLAAGANMGYVSFGTNKDTSTITFEKNLNFKVNGGVLRFRNYDTISKATVGGGLQFIISKDTSLGNADYPLTNLTNNLKKADGSAADMWTLKVDGDKMQYVEFIEGEAGKFNIASNCGATVTKVDDPSVTYTVGEGEKLLDLSGKPGEYTVDVIVYREKILEYYVGFGGTGDGSSLAQMAPNVATAITTMNDCRLSEDEVATIYIVQDIEKPDMVGDENAYNNKFGYHNLAAWTDVGVTVPEHKNKVIIKAHSSNADKFTTLAADTYLAFDNLIGRGENLYLSGPTEFQNLTLVYTYGTSESSHINPYSVINANGNDLTIGENVKYGYISALSNSEATWATTNKITAHNLFGFGFGKAGEVYDEAFKVAFNAPIGYSGARIDFPSAEKGNYTFNKDVTLEFNASTHITGIRFGKDAEAVATFNQNINIKFNNTATTTKSIRLYGGASTVTVKGGVQIIDTGVDYSDNGSDYTAWNTIEELVDENGNPAKIWEMKVDKVNVEYVDFIEGETGKFKAFKGERFLATASNEDSSVVVSADANGIIDLSGKPGTYTVTFAEIEIEDDEYETFINYRGYVDGVTNYNGAMANTYKKLRTENELNIVYFGGSVTAGSGSTDGGSWRERIGNWMVNNFPSVKINNIDQAVGETGTYLGVYRVARDIITKNPDVLFIEYSINDYYDKASYDRASMQYETIVRNVKEAHPDCDIITVLVTDVYCARSAANGNLHTQAQAHEDIAAKYNIPTLHVGRALATHVVAEGWTSGQDAVWSKYVKDIVHPLNTGYDIYYKVIKEFMCNTLLFGNYGEYEIADQVLPEMVNKYLRDGEMTYIDEQDVPFTTEGGASWHDMTGIVDKQTYAGLICVPAGSQDIITVEFNGTELVMIAKAGIDANVNNQPNTYQVSLDGGETWETKQYAGKNPIVIAAGLEGGAHTALIKPASLSEVRVGGFFSRNAEKATNRLNITDLVHIDETYASNTTLDYRDYNNDDVVDAKDIITAKKMLLNNK